MKILLIIGCILASISCRKEDDSQIKSLISGQGNEKIALGAAFNSLTGAFNLGEGCVAANPEFTELMPANKSNLDGGYAESFQSVSDKIEVSGTAKLNLGIGKLKASLGVSNALADSDLKTSYYVSYTHDLGSVFLKKSQLNQKGISSRSVDIIERFKNCGDEYVNQIELGARLHVGLEFSFHSKEMKQVFDYAVKIEDKITGKSVLDFHDSKDLQYADLVADVKVIFLQEGGDQNKYNAIKNSLSKSCFIQGGDARHIKESGFGAKEQLLGEDFELCLADYKRLTQYAFTDFSKQIKTDLNPSSWKQLAPLHIHTRPYINMGYPEFNRMDLELPKKVLEFYKKLTTLKDLYIRLLSGNTSYNNMLNNRKPVYVQAIEKIYQQQKAQQSCDVYKEFPSGSLFQKIELLVNKNLQALDQTESAMESCDTRIYDAIIKAKQSPNNNLENVLSECSDRLFGSSEAEGMIQNIEKRLSNMCL